MKLRALTYLLVSLLPFMACTALDDAAYVPVFEFDYAFVDAGGRLVKDDGAFAVPAAGDTLRVRILSNQDVTVNPAADDYSNWMSLTGSMQFHGDQTLIAVMQPNEGLRRGLLLKATVPGVDTLNIVLRQEGISSLLECKEPYKTALGSTACDVLFPVVTNLTPEDVSITVEYFSGESWIESASLQEDGLLVRLPANGDSAPRKAMVLLSYIDGWAQSRTLSLFLSQASSDDAFGKKLSFAELRSLASATGLQPEDGLTVEGIVVSDCASANTAANPVITLDAAEEFRNRGVSETVRTSVMQVVDTTATSRTVYLEAPDGSSGLRLLFDDPAGNRLQFGTLLTLSLDGTTLLREDVPERYTVSGIGEKNLLQSIPEVDVPVKDKTISTLTAEDLYTFVGLTGVEFPVKEGSYTDIRENHALLTSVNSGSVSATDSKRYFYMDGYSNFLLDGEGAGICAPVNMLCTWRKPSSGIPKGFGTARGVLVHEEIPRYGNAGIWQLRVVDQSGFESMSESQAQWKTIASWDRGKILPSLGSAKMTCGKKDAKTGDEHSYKSVKAVTGRTCGISDTYRSLRVQGPINGWYEWAEDGSLAGYNGLIIDFSTKALEGTCLAVVFRFYAGRSGTPSTFQAFPSHWTVDYSYDGGETWQQASNSDRSGENYVHLRSIATYTLQYGSYKIPTPSSACLGPSCHVFTLPSDAFGRQSVRVRLRPADTVMSTLPTIFTDEVETGHVTAASTVTDYVSFQDIFIKYKQ